MLIPSLHNLLTQLAKYTAKIKPFLFVILALSFTSIYLIKTSIAADATVICDSAGCSGFLGALFSEANTAPGHAASKAFEVKNQRSESLALSLSGEKEAGTNDEFLPQIDVSVGQTGGANLFSGNLQTFLGGTPVDLGSLAAGDSGNYEISLNFNSAAGNEYQGKVANFDLSVNIVGQEAGVLSSASPPVCSDTAPSSAPALFLLSTGGNSILLGWTSVSPVTHYMIRYGGSSGVYIYGASDVGNVTQFNVEALSGGTVYYFQVAGVNGCAPGSWSNEVAGVTSGAVLAAGPATGFEQEVLGEETVGQFYPTPWELVQASSCADEPYYWWIILVVEALLGITVLAVLWNDSQARYWMIVPGLLAIFSQVIHEVLGCNCATDGWCPYYWIANLAIAIVLTVAYFLRFRAP